MVEDTARHLNKRQSKNLAVLTTPAAYLRESSRDFDPLFTHRVESFLPALDSKRGKDVKELIQTLTMLRTHKVALRVTLLFPVFCLLFLFCFPRCFGWLSIDGLGETGLIQDRRCAATFPNNKTPDNYAQQLAAEIKAYQASSKFHAKIEEALENTDIMLLERWINILKMVRPLVAGDKDVLDLGCAAGRLLIEVRKAGGNGGTLTGVELVPGWVDFAKESIAAKYNIEFINGDITEVQVGKTFDVILLTDSMEHIPRYRLKSLWNVIHLHSQEDAFVYIHVPTPERQLRTSTGQGGDVQHCEEVVQYSELIAMAACFGFQLSHFKLDADGSGGYASILLQKS